MKSILPVFLCILFITACNQPESDSKAKNYAVKTASVKTEFNDYWYQGKAEITSYDLEQSRYGELHQGHAVLIFVTEHFSDSKKVKLDNPALAPKDAIPVLKLNATRKFNTGIYPYSMMTSTFTPVDLKENPSSLKVSGSSQEWCGHTFMQLSEAKNHFDMELRSYFESEGDVNKKVDKTLLEDEIWNRLRIDPKSLPDGKVNILPDVMFARLKHIDYKPYPAEVEMKPHATDAALMTYEVVYTSGVERSLKIHFTKEFPHSIEGWEESGKSGFGPGAKTLVTKATRKKVLMTDYWSRNNNKDAYLREELGLSR